MLRSVLNIAAVVALGAAAVPQIAAAQSSYEDGPRPYTLRMQDDLFVDCDHARIARRQDVGPADRDDARPSAPRVVYDGRDLYRPDRPVYGYGPDASGAGWPAFGSGYRSGSAEAAYGVDPMLVGPVPVGSVYGTTPQAACTIEQSRGITPAGWRKIVTHTICYRR